jgi:hypothetical protein
MTQYGRARVCTFVGNESGRSQMTRTFVGYPGMCWLARSTTGNQEWHPEPLNYNQTPVRSIDRNRNCVSLTCILGSIIGIVDEYLTERKHAHRLGKLRPKVLANVFDRVNAQSIRAIILH